MSRFIPWRERCAMECGQRKAPGMNVCWNCYRRGSGRSAPGRDVAPSGEGGGDRPLRETKPASATPSEPVINLREPDPVSIEDERALRRTMLRHPAGGKLRMIPGYEPTDQTDMDDIGGIGL